MGEPRAMTVRFPTDAYEYVQGAADMLGISVSQFVREAALMRAMLTYGDSEQARAVTDAMAALRDSLREQRRLDSS